MLRRETLVCSSRLNTFSLPLSSSPMHSSSLSNAAAVAVAGDTFLDAGTTCRCSLASQFLDSGELAIDDDMSGDIAAHPRKTASDAAAMAAAASATASPTPSPVVASAAGVLDAAWRIAPARRHSSFSVRLRARPRRPRRRRRAGRRTAPRHALPQREQRRLERAVRVGEHEESVVARRRRRLATVERRDGHRQLEDLAERGEHGLHERETRAPLAAGAGRRRPRHELPHTAVEPREFRVVARVARRAGVRRLPPRAKCQVHRCVVVVFVISSKTKRRRRGVYIIRDGRRTRGWLRVAAKKNRGISHDSVGVFLQLAHGAARAAVSGIVDRKLGVRLVVSRS